MSQASQSNQKKMKLLYEYVQRGDFQKLKEFLDQNKDIDLNVRIVGETLLEGETLLYRACWGGQYRDCTIIVKKWSGRFS